jgi:acyl carrier protein
MHSRDEILATVKEILAVEFEIDRDVVALDTRLADELDLDSIDAIDLAVRLEERSGHALEEDELKALETIRDVVELVYSKLERGAA